MTIALFLSCLGLLVLQTVPQQDAPDDQKILIRFEMHSPDLASDVKVFITGNLPELGNWNSVRL